ncbi:MAG: DUF1549 domain-containing protein, partial [Planctomycetia bacterium]|nr:DUF1549 domain-containing protein [Planctomycetia bacterium]
MTNPLHTTLGRTLAVVCTWLLCVTPAWAKPAHKKALADYFGPFLPKKLNDCRTCHVAEQPGQEDDKPHNVFGERLKAVRKELGRAGKTNDLAACLDALATEDSDGDGAANLTELLAGRYPGEADDRPTPAEVETAAVKLPGLRKLRNGYPWRPFQTVQRPPVPQVKNAAWVRNPIDAFIAAEHEERGLQPRPEAARPVLVRRVYLDLLGLPPTRDELRAAVEDQAADWYEQLVDKLLASPRHGERWGRHWMDVWRYSDWYGYNGEIRHSQPHVWRWRDWIVEAVNADKGYDRMLVEMLAGDELAPDDPDVVRATGYLVRNYNRHHRDKWLQETVDHTFQAFLGLTIGCARCHDHMYDPLSQQDYYQVRAFFEPHQVRIDQLPGKLDPVKIDNLTIPGNGLARVYDADGKAPTYLFTRGDETKPDKSAVIMPGVPKSLGGELPAIAPVRLPASAFDPEKRDWVIREQVESATAARDRAAAGRETSRRQVVLAAGLLIGGEPLANAMALPTLQKSLDALGAADLDAELTDARHAALLTVLHAERLEDSERFGTDEWRTAAFAAAAVQRRLAVA